MPADTSPQHWFNPRLSAATPALAALVEGAWALYCRASALTRRPHKHRLKVEALVCSAVHAQLSGSMETKFRLDEGWYKSRATRHERHALETKHLPRVAKALAESGVLVIERGTQRNGLSRLSPGSWLMERLRQHQFSFDDFAREPPPSVVLRRNGARISLPNAPEWAAARDRIDGLNAQFQRLEFAMPGATREWDLGERYLQRLFSNDMHGYGRMHGAFWIGMPRTERSYLTCDGEHLTQLDVSAMFLTLLYAREGFSVPAEPYRIREVEHAFGSLGYDPHTAAQKAREAVKTLTSAIQFDQKARTKYPKDTEITWPKGGMTAVEMITAIKKRHAAVAHHFGTGVGHAHFHDESEIVLATVEACFAAGIPALPVHDAILVKTSTAERAAPIFAEAFKARAGQWPILTSKVLCPPLSQAFLRAFGLADERGTFASTASRPPRWINRQIRVTPPSRYTRRPEDAEIARAVISAYDRRLQFDRNQVLSKLLFTMEASEQWVRLELRHAPATKQVEQATTRLLKNIARACVMNLRKPEILLLVEELKAAGLLQGGLTLASRHSKKGPPLP